MNVLAVLADDVLFPASSFLLVFLLLMVVAVAAFVFWVWAIVDAAKRPEAQWVAANQNKALWLVVLVVVGIWGPGALVALVYVLWPRPLLKAAEAGPVGYGPNPSTPVD